MSIDLQGSLSAVRDSLRVLCSQSGAHGSAAVVADKQILIQNETMANSELFYCETCFKRRKCFVHREDRGDDGLQFSRRCSRAQGLMADGAGGAIFGGVRYFPAGKMHVDLIC